MKIKFFAISLVILFVILGCNLPVSQASQHSLGLTVTSIAKTIYATVATQPAEGTATPGPGVSPTTAQSAESPVPEATSTPRVIYVEVTPTEEDNGNYSNGYPDYNYGYYYGYVCDNASYVSDVTIPDYTEIYPGDTFRKTWKIYNSGNCTWDKDYEFIHVSGKRLSGDDINLKKEVDPGEYIKVSIDMTAPDHEGIYTGYWRMVNDNGNEFGDTFSVVIDVDEDADANTPTKTRTPTASSIPASTSTHTSTMVPTSTMTPTYTITPSATFTFTPTFTITPSVTPTDTPHP
jgi:hypothetical protein